MGSLFSAGCLRTHVHCHILPAGEFDRREKTSADLEIRKESSKKLRAGASPVPVSTVPRQQSQIRINDATLCRVVFGHFPHGFRSGEDVVFGHAFVNVKRMPV